MNSVACSLIRTSTRQWAKQAIRMEIGMLMSGLQIFWKDVEELNMKRYLQKLMNNKLITNSIWLYALQFFNLVVPLLTLPYITRNLGSKSYGTFSIALNIVIYLQVIVEYGFGMSATRKVAIKKKENLDKTFTTVLLGRAILLVCGLCIAAIYLLFNLNNRPLCINFVLLLIGLLGCCVQMNWVFQGLQEMKYISIINVFGRTVSTGLIFFLVKKPDDLFTYSLLYSISPFLSGFSGLFIARKRYSLKFVKVHLNDVLGELKDGFYVFTTQLSSKVFGAIGITVLGIYTTTSVVGVFSAIQKIPNILILLWAPIAQIVYPISSAKFSKNFSVGYNFVKNVRKRVMPLFVVVALGLSVFAKSVVQISFGFEYAMYYMWLYPLLLWLLIAIDNNFLGIQILLGSGHDKEYGRAFNISVAFTIFVNFILIYLFSGFGAALAPLLSEIALNLLLRKEAAPIIKEKVK